MAPVSLFTVFDSFKRCTQFFLLIILTITIQYYYIIVISSFNNILGPIVSRAVYETAPSMFCLTVLQYYQLI